MAGESETTSGGTAPVSNAANTPAEKKKGFLTWDHSLEIFKVVATVWVAGVGTFVTMQFNERQHELNRIEAIAQMLPHLSQKTESTPSGKSGAGTPSGPQAKSDMSRDGAIWAIYRTANNKTMLRDLASLFPEDIYRVVSSTAAGGGLAHDEDALTALGVASEKLATKYSNEKKTELAIRLYNQALHLKQRRPQDTTPLFIVDITDAEVQDQPVADQTASLVAAVN